MGELISKLGIDWRLLIANTVTFFIVLWVLRRFAFKPIMNVLEQRQRLAAETVTKSKQVDAQAVALEAEKQRILQEAKTEALKIVHHAKDEGETIRTQIVNDAQAEASATVAKTKVLLERQKTEMIAQAKGELADLVVEATAKVVGEQLDGPLQHKLAEKTIAQLTKTA